MVKHFTLTEVMDAVKTAFALVGGETARDCVVEQTIKETLSARSHGKAGIRTLLAEREETKP